MKNSFLNKTLQLSSVLKSGKTIMNSFSMRSFYIYVRFILWITGLSKNSSHVSDFNKLRDRILVLQKKSGNTFLVQYLKEGHRLLSKTLAGEKPVNGSPRVSTRRGLPLMIPGPLRLLMEKSDSSIISVVLTILCIYSTMICFPNLKLNTITDPFSGVFTTLPEVPIMVSTLLHVADNSKGLGKSLLSSKGDELLVLSSSGPNVKVQMFGYAYDAIAWRESEEKHPELLQAFEYMSTYFNNTLYKTLTLDMRNPYSNEKFLNQTLSNYRKKGELCLGRLAFKNEAAGKVRVFAIVDGWTQSLLGPLHKYLFDILSKMAEDGTFDQHGPMNSLVRKNLPFLGSYDLSAATDRLPMDLQVQILSSLTNEEFGLAWKTLLTGSGFLNPRSGDFVQYAVGQPMGCLSSWAMLAITHHVMVQIAASSAGVVTWFADYAMLGDDMVMGDKSVANSYLVIMKDLGVEINLSKSVISTSNSLEFAKRLMVQGSDVSPYGPKALLQIVNAPQKSSDFLLMILSNEKVTTSLGELSSLFSDVSSLGGFKKKIHSKYWDLCSMFGLNLGLDLSSTFNSQGMSSLNQEEQTMFSQCLDNVCKDRLLSNWLSDIESSTSNYWVNQYLFMMSGLNVFPSTNLLKKAEYSKFDLFNKTKEELILLSEDDSVIHAFKNGLTMGDWSKQDLKERNNIKSLHLSRLLHEELMSVSPSIAMKMTLESLNFFSSDWDTVRGSKYN